MIQTQAVWHQNQCSWTLLLCCLNMNMKYVFIPNLESFFYIMTTEFRKTAWLSFVQSDKIFYECLICTWNFARFCEELRQIPTFKELSALFGGRDADTHDNIDPLGLHGIRNDLKPKCILQVQKVNQKKLMSIKEMRKTFQKSWP